MTCGAKRGAAAAFIIRAMLRWLLMLTIALLPWHGWAGASIVRAADSAPAALHAPHEAQEAGHAAADCLDHVDAAGIGDAGAGAGCPGCSMCHACSPVGLPAMAVVADGTAQSPVRPATAPSRFASAEPTPGLKPPIS